MVTILLFHAIIITQLWVVSRTKTVSLKEVLRILLVGLSVGAVATFVAQGLFLFVISEDTLSFTAGPIIEEVFKIAFVAFLLFKTRFGKTTSIIDGVILGAAAGAGFGISEDIIRAIGQGLESMLVGFPGYAWGGLLKSLLVWLPDERGLMYGPGGHNMSIAGHTIWTALVGLGFSTARVINKKIRLNIAIPLVLLTWVTLDHIIINYMYAGGFFGTLGDPPAFLAGFYALTMYGKTIRYALTIGIVIAVIIDEILILRHLPKDNWLLLPGEKKRSLLGELHITLLNMRFGWRHWKGLINYFRLRRQLAFAARREEDVSDLIKLLRKTKQSVILSAKVTKEAQVYRPPSIMKKVQQGPVVKWKDLNKWQRLSLMMGMLMMLVMIFFVWFFLFSIYLPWKVTSAILASPILPVLGVFGFALTVYSLFLFYKQKQWRNLSYNLSNRVEKYINPLLIHTGGLTAMLSIPGFFGITPFFNNSFLLGQIGRMLNDLAAAWKWVGGVISAGINLVPVIGNIKSGLEALIGYDMLGNELSNAEKLVAGLGAIPVFGNMLRGARSIRALRPIVRAGIKALRLMKPAIKMAQAYGGVMGKFGFAQKTAELYGNALNELIEKAPGLSAGASQKIHRNRQSAYNNWGGESKVAIFHAVDIGSMPISATIGSSMFKLVNVKMSGVGQVVVDPNTKTIVFDNITGNSSNSRPNIKNQINTLKRANKDYQVIHRDFRQNGLMIDTTMTPDGALQQNVITNPKLPSSDMSSAVTV